MRYCIHLSDRETPFPELVFTSPGVALSLKSLLEMGCGPQLMTCFSVLSNGIEKSKSVASRTHLEPK